MSFRRLPAAITIAVFGTVGFATVAPLRALVMDKPALALAGLLVAVISGMLDHGRRKARRTEPAPAA
ncbi:hypothetical protein [Amycolatopsis sp. NPDC051071]|uniref:hypothetical protein n=1 Tax=Amycolatopsis sp. NPDC051071 TaxID=3154637 RepID=UPI0034264B41